MFTGVCLTIFVFAFFFFSLAIVQCRLSSFVEPPHPRGLQSWILCLPYFVFCTPPPFFVLVSACWLVCMPMGRVGEGSKYKLHTHSTIVFVPSTMLLPWQKNWDNRAHRGTGACSLKHARAIVRLAWLSQFFGQGSRTRKSSHRLWSRM